MAQKIIDINVESQPFITEYCSLNLKGFIINVNGEHFIISVHHFIPINSIVETQTNIPLPIHINPDWNEVLILKSDTINLSKFFINKKIQKNIPKPQTNLVIESGSIQFPVQVVGYDFVPFNNIKQYSRILHIIVIMPEEKHNYVGLSGSPVYAGDKIVGIFTKYNKVSNMGFIIPIYYALKTLQKIDNHGIYGLDIKYDIKKINTFNVKNNEVYHQSLRYNLPLDAFFLLEGDISVKYNVQYQQIINEKSKLRTKEFESEAIIQCLLPNDSNIITRTNDRKNEYKVNLRLFVFLLKFSGQTSLAHEIITLALNKSDKSSEIWFEPACKEDESHTKESGCV